MINNNCIIFLWVAIYNKQFQFPLKGTLLFHVRGFTLKLSCIHSLDGRHASSYPWDSLFEELPFRYRKLKLREFTEKLFLSRFLELRAHSLGMWSLWCLLNRWTSRREISLTKRMQILKTVGIEEIIQQAEAYQLSEQTVAETSDLSGF